MSEFHDKLFDKVQQNSDISSQAIYQVADSLNQTDFSDEETIRSLVQRLATLADSPVSKEKEDKIVESITQNNMPADMQSINNLFKNQP
ncbi:stage VI sporulation protein F [Barrientosiimonas marina]|uniref:Stage VI sporulation protein F n=1 Tax=Lentibacillus kimchii TaxID=1542911 RepID=A0ABW2V058_9BACI